MKRLLGWVLVSAWLSLLLCGCGDDGLMAVGTEGGPCFSNGTCNYGLNCFSDLCVDAGCQPGDTQACSCPGDSVGTQLCGSDSFWDACDCPAGCGDGVCGADETSASCPADCSGDMCGDDSCEAGETCYDTVCWAGLPPCMDPGDPDHIGWPSDADLEPNGAPEQAVVLPCGDDGVFTDPAEYQARCPSRTDYTNGFMNLLLCPGGETDVYSIFLLADESVEFRVLHQYSSMLPRDLDARVLRYDSVLEEYVEVTGSYTTTDNEDLSVIADTLVNPQGWYFLVVQGKTDLDVNYYTVSFTINPTGV